MIWTRWCLFLYEACSKLNIKYWILNISLGQRYILLEFATFFIILSVDILYSILLAFVISLSDYFAKNLKKKLNHTLSRKGDSKCMVSLNPWNSRSFWKCVVAGGSLWGRKRLLWCLLNITLLHLPHPNSIMQWCISCTISYQGSIYWTWH